MYIAIWVGGMPLFQSLFCWKFLLGPKSEKLETLYWRVSILVLLEVPLRPSADPAYVRVYSFQSLFCWKFLLGREALWGLDGRKDGVSILVLLEVPLRPVYGKNIWWTCKCMVSILVLLEVPLRPSPVSSSLTISGSFQSLFCWKFLLGHLYEIKGDNNDWVSILVLLEVPLRPEKVDKPKRRGRPFQSLFCWKFLLGISQSIPLSYML